VLRCFQVVAGWLAGLAGVVAGMLAGLSGL